MRELLKSWWVLERYDPPGAASLPNALLRRIRITNRMAMVSLMVHLVAIPLMIATKAPASVRAIVAITAVAFAMPCVLSPRGFLRLPRHWLATVCLLAPAAFVVAFGPHIATLFAAGAIAPFTLFTPQERRTRFLYSAAAVLLAVVFAVVPIEPLRPRPEALMPLLRGMAWVFSMSIAFGHMFLADREARLYERELEDALREAHAASEAKESFLANMSHELRTPMNGVIGMTSLLKRSGLTPQQQGMVDVVHDSGEALLVLLNDILDLAKLRAGKFLVRPEAVDVRPLLHDVGALILPAATERGVEVIVEVDEAVPAWGSTDPTRVRQVVSNLLGNAARFTTQGHIAVRAHMEEDRLRIDVEDTGPGIPEADRARIFEPFEQLDKRTTRGHGGTGLGLSIVRELCTAMGGQIAVSSTKGRGTTFTVHLPFPAVEGPSTSPAHERRPVAALRVLVVDDNAVNQKVTLSMLEHLGVEATAVNSGEAALQAFEARPYDLIFLDVQMPGIDGLETSRRLRGMPGGSVVTLCALTARAQAKDREACLAAGMDGYLTKPLRLEELERTLSQLSTGGRAQAA